MYMCQLTAQLYGLYISRNGNVCKTNFLFTYSVNSSRYICRTNNNKSIDRENKSKSQQLQIYRSIHPRISIINHKTFFSMSNRTTQPASSRSYPPSRQSSPFSRLVSCQQNIVRSGKGINERKTLSCQCSQ